MECLYPSTFAWPEFHQEEEVEEIYYVHAASTGL